MQTLVHLIIAWLSADLLSGLLHWVVDRYLPETSKLSSGTMALRRHATHHRSPEKVAQETPWENIKAIALITWPLATAAWIIGLHDYIWATLLFFSFSGLIHRWAHMPWDELPRTVRSLQELGLFAGNEQHKEHHYDDDLLVYPPANASRRYCVMSDWLNPTLDYWRVWDKLEWIIGLAGVKPHPRIPGAGDRRPEPVTVACEGRRRDQDPSQEQCPSGRLIDQLRQHAKYFQEQRPDNHPLQPVAEDH